MQSWYIENPISKELVKSLTIRLSAKAEKEFIIVLKAPVNQYQQNLVSFLTFKMPSSQQNALRRHQSSTVSGSQSDLSSEGGSAVTEKHLKKRGTDISDIEIEKTVSNPEGNLAEKTLRVMLLGRLDNPRIRCHRSLHHSDSDMQVLSILLKKKP